MVTPVATPTNAAPSFSWTDTEPTAVIFHVLRGATCGSAVQIDANATSPFTDSALALDGSDDGSYCYVVESHDVSDVLIDSGSATIVLDHTVPVVGPLAAPATGTFRSGSITVQTPASDATAGLSSVVFWGSKNGGGFGSIGGVVTESAGSFSSTWTTSASDDGTWVIRAIATDLATNTSTSATVTITVDNTLPTIPTFSGLPQNNATIGVGEMVIPFTGGTDANLVNVQVETQSQMQVAGNEWTPRTTTTTSPVRWTPLPADDCSCNFRLVATDQAGNTRISAPRTNVKLDNFPPIAPSLFRIDRAITNGPPILTWTQSTSGDIVGYKLVRDAVHLQGNGGLLDPLTLAYTDTGLARDGSEDGAHSYSLTANDGGNDSPAKFVTFFLDSMAPTPPTAPTAKRRANLRLVDLTWGESDDTQASSGASPTGIGRYVVRRAISPGIPSSATSGAAACDVAATVTSCIDSTAPEGHTYRYAIFAVDKAGNGSAGAGPAAVVIPDLTPPGAPAAFSVKPKGLTMAMTWRLPVAPDLSRIVIVRNPSHTPKGIADGKVVFAGKASRASAKQLGGTTAFYRAFALDKAGNVSATRGVRIRQPVFRLFPENGSELRGTVRLTWKKPKRATFFNVQVYLGSKRVTQAWPKNAGFKIPRSKLTRGKTYTWYVWPGVGRKAAGRYGTIIGKSTFTYLG